VGSFTRGSYERLGDSSRVARAARLKDFSDRVAALARLAVQVCSDHRLSPRHRDEVLARVESSLCRASAALGKGSYRVGARGLWLRLEPPEGVARKDSTRTSPTI